LPGQTGITATPSRRDENLWRAIAQQRELRSITAADQARAALAGAAQAGAGGRMPGDAGLGAALQQRNIQGGAPNLIIQGAQGLERGTQAFENLLGGQSSGAPYSDKGNIMGAKLANPGLSETLATRLPGGR
jgi:hypothetical protein